MYISKSLTEGASGYSGTPQTMEETTLITLSDLDLELVALITLTLNTREYIRFSSTCKAFREFIKKKVIKKRFTGQSLFNRLKIPAEILRVSKNLEYNSLRGLEESCSDLALIDTSKEALLVLKDSLVHRELLNRGYVPSKVTISTYLEFCSTVYRCSRNMWSHALDNLEAVLEAESLILQEGKFNSFSDLDIEEPFGTLAPFCSLSILGISELFAKVGETIYSANRVAPFVAIEDSNSSECCVSCYQLSDLVVMYKEGIDNKIEKILRKISKKLIRNLKSITESLQQPSN